jgi:hypothetical protein
MHHKIKVHLVVIYVYIFYKSNTEHIKIHLILLSDLGLGLQSGPFPLGLRIKNLYAPLLYPIRATCPANFTILDLITRILFGEWRT